jgi:hypothetical protein
MSKFARLAAVLAALLMVAGPASADHTAPDTPFVPEYVETPVYLHCNGNTKVSNIHALQGSLVTWDGTKPAASYTSGAGCGTAETFAEGTADRNVLYDFNVRGTYKGNIDNITLRFWAIDLSGSRALDEFTVDLHVTIDGKDILKRPTEAHAPTIASSTGIARLYEVTITNVRLNTLTDHTTEHDVEITAYTKFIDGSGVLAWVYDASEIDSGLVFNDKTPSAVKVRRNG